MEKLLEAVRALQLNGHACILDRSYPKAKCFICEIIRAARPCRIGS